MNLVSYWKNYGNTSKVFFTCSLPDIKKSVVYKAYMLNRNSSALDMGKYFQLVKNGESPFF